jgi:hypothetical protein
VGAPTPAIATPVCTRGAVCAALLVAVAKLAPACSAAGATPCAAPSTGATAAAITDGAECVADPLAAATATMLAAAPEAANAGAARIARGAGAARTTAPEASNGGTLSTAPTLMRLELPRMNADGLASKITFAVRASTTGS